MAINMITLSELEAVLLDLDGTLVFTPFEYRKRIVKKSLKDVGINSCSREDVDSFWYGTERARIITDRFGIEKPGLYWRAYCKHDTAEARKQFARPYDDSGYVLELRQRGIKTAIVTGAPPHIADVEINMLGKENFDAVVVASPLNGRKPKPNPECIEECLGMLGVGKEKAVYVGNAEEDVITANNAGIPCIIVDRKECKLEFKEAKPLYVISSLYEMR